MSFLTRVFLGVAAAANLILGLGYAFQTSWAVSLMPWETGRLSYIFLGSILMAIAAGLGWIALSGEMGSMPAGFLNLTVLLGGVGAYMLVQGVRDEPNNWIAYGLAGLALAVVNFVLFLRTRNVRIPDPDPLPLLVRASYVLFTAVLIGVGGSLILQRDGVMPWPLDAHTSALIGWIFLGNSFYFLFAALRPNWQTGRAQLWSFLAYDVVLLVPLLGHISNVPADLRSNLFIYLAVVLYSAVLAVYFVILNPQTRGWGTVTVAPAGGED